MSNDEGKDTDAKSESALNISTTTTTHKGYEYSKSEASQGSTYISASKTVNELGKNQTVVTSTVNSKTSETHRKSSDTTYTVEDFSDLHGHSVKTTSSYSETTFNRKGKPLSETHQDTEKHYSAPGALEIATDHDQSHSTTSTTTTRSSLDKNGKIKNYALQSTIDNQTYKSRRDLRDRLSSDQQSIKKSEEITSTNGDIAVSSISHNREFKYTENTNRTATATQYNKRTKTSIEVHRDTDGNFKGIKVRAQITKDCQKAHTLSKRKAERIFNRCQSKADQIVRKVSDAQNTEDYRQTTIPANTSRMSVKEVFKQEAKEKMDANKSIVASRNAEPLAAAKKTTTEQMVQKKWNEMHNR